MTIKKVPLSQVAALNPAAKNTPSPDELVSFLGMADVSEDGTTSKGTARPWREVSKGYTVFRREDLLVAKITPCFQNGKIAQAAISHEIGAGSTEFHVVRPSHEVDGRYLLHFLRQHWIRREGELRMTGSGGQRRVPQSYLGALPVPLLPLAEQRRVSALLDEVDALRAKRRQTITLLDDLARSIFIDRFGDPTAPSVRWERKPLGELGNIVTGNTPPRSNSANYGEGIEWIKTDNITPAEIFVTPATERLSAKGESVGRTVPGDAILVTCIAGSPSSIGRCALAGRKVAINQQINAFIPRAVIPRFMLEQFRISKRLIQEKSTGGMKGMVSKSQFASIQAICPPIDKQREFVKSVEALDSVRQEQTAHLHDLDDLFTSLQHRAFSGTLWDHEAAA